MSKNKDVCCYQKKMVLWIIFQVYSPKVDLVLAAHSFLGIFTMSESAMKELPKVNTNLLTKNNVEDTEPDPLIEKVERKLRTPSPVASTAEKTDSRYQSYPSVPDFLLWNSAT